jgi:hypothetical protein
MVWRRRTQVGKLNKEINAGQTGDEGAACRLGGTVLPLPPLDFGKLIADETEKWAR